VAPGRRLSLQGQEAARFAADVLPNFKGRVEGRAIAERMKLHDVKLVPEWLEDAQQQLVLSFRMPRPRQVGLDDSGMAEANAPTGQASLEEVVAAWQEGRSLIPLMDGGFARLPHDWMEQYGTLVEALLEAREQNEPALTRLARATLLEAVPTPPELDRLKKAALDQLAIPPVSVPAGLKASLRGYQLEGLAQLVHWQREKQGGILADDMGLGKTIQTLALMLTDPPDAPPSLVVAPTSVLENWAREATKFAPGLTTAIYHGEDRELAGLDASGEKRVRLLITSYGILRRDEAILAERSWQRLILDEAQAIKNPDSQAAAAARKIGARALHRLALTGTPVENRLAEIWSLLEFLNPGLLGDKRRFEDTFSRPVLQGDRKMLERLRIRVRPFLLRRLKQDVAKDLPPKTERILKAELSAHERKVYEAVRTAGRSEVRKLMKEKGLRGSQLQILEILLRLRQACCHPGLVPGASSEHELGSSAKLELLVDELEVILEEGHKALVFSQWTSLLDRAQQRLEKAGISYVRLDGSTRNRQEVVDQFQSETGPGVFLISLKAGGVGLNLTAADHVFLLDPWWNPAAEDQATDRAYRIGQTRPVFVSRLIAARTIEERVQWLQEQKRAIADAALGGEVSFLESLDEQGIELLLSM
jgi:SNF2 family DNA or RNA helicase